MSDMLGYHCVECTGKGGEDHFYKTSKDPSPCPLCGREGCLISYSPPKLSWRERCANALGKDGG